MRLRATFYDEALKPYPLAVLINIVGILLVPGTFLLFHFGLGLTSMRWTFVSIGLGLVACCVMLALGSLVEDVHDIKMHTMCFDVEEPLPETVAAAEKAAEEIAEAASAVEKAAEEDGEAAPADPA